MYGLSNIVSLTKDLCVRRTWSDRFFELLVSNYHTSRSYATECTHDKLLLLSR